MEFHKTFERDKKKINEINANSGAQVERPWRGGHLWIGEDEAWEAAQELVDVADGHPPCVGWARCTI